MPRPKPPRRPTTLRPDLVRLEDRCTPAVFVVNTTLDVTDPNDDLLSLREAVAAVNALDVDGEVHTIRFDPSLAGRTFTLLDDGDVFTRDGLEIRNNVDVVGFESNPILVNEAFEESAQFSDLFDVGAGVTVSITGVNVRNEKLGSAVRNAGDLTLTAVTVTGATNLNAVFNDTTGTLRMIESTIRDNMTTGLANAGTATLIDTEIVNNVSDRSFVGAGIDNFGSSLTITRGRIVDNRSVDPDDGVGGGIFHAEGTLNINGTVIRGNSATLVGGGLAVADGTVTITGDTRIEGNTAKLGGGVAVVGAEQKTTVLRPTFTMTGGTVGQNTAVSAAGIAVAANKESVSPTVILTDVNITGNTAEQNASGTLTVSLDVGEQEPIVFVVPRGNAGGLGVSRGDVTVDGGVITGNKATLAGGIGLQIGELTLTGVAVDDNRAVTGGGAVVVATGAIAPRLVVNGGSFSNNRVEENADPNATITYDIPGMMVPAVPRGAGGGLIVAGGEADVIGTTIAGNRASLAGGVAVQSGVVTLDSVRIDDNRATAEVGGLGVIGGTVTLREAIVSNNQARAGGGVGTQGGSLTVIRSTISGNRATGAGATGAGGGVGAVGGAITVRQSTIDGNSAAQAGGIGVGPGATVTLVGVTVTANSADGAGGVGVDAGATVTVRNSVMALNSALLGKDAVGLFTSEGGNLIGAADLAQGFNATGDRTGTASAPLDPRLGPLTDNGGPTPTRLPLGGSPLIDAGNPFGADPVDQRGFPRVSGAGIDTGAVEVQPTDNRPPVAADDELTVAQDTGSVPINVLANDADPDGDPLRIIAFTPPTAGGTVAITGGGTGLTYRPAAGFFGTDTFTYTITDGRGGTDTATVTVTVSERIGPPPPPPPQENRPPIAVDDFFPGRGPTAVLDVLANDSDPDGDPLTIVSVTQPEGAVVTISPDGQTLRFDNLLPGNRTFTFTYTISDGRGGGDTASVTVISTRAGGPEALPKAFSVGPGPGGVPIVNVYNPDGSLRFSTLAFGGDVIGGVRVAMGDVNGDGIPDLVVGSGPGSPSLVRVIDGATQQELFSIAPFEASFLGGVFVSLGDVTGDGRADLIISPDEGGGPRVRIFDVNSGAQIADFFGIEDSDFRGGARTAVADVTGDGFGDVLVAAGFGGGPRLAVFGGSSVTGGSPTKPFQDFFVFEQTLRNGVFVTGGDLDGDGRADVIVGGGPGGGPRVFALSGAGLLDGRQTQLANFFAGDPNNRGGVRVTVANLDGDDRADLVVGAGDGAGSRVTAYLGSLIGPENAPPPALAFDAFPGFPNGVFVG